MVSIQLSPPGVASPSTRRSAAICTVRLLSSTAWPGHAASISTSGPFDQGTQKGDRTPPERHGLGPTKQHGVMRVQAKWTQRIDHCASDITSFRRNFADFSDRLQDSRPRKEQTVDRPWPYRTRARPGAERCPGRFRLMPTTANSHRLRRTRRLAVNGRYSGCLPLTSETHVFSASQQQGGV
jgi:hypothetical protein